MSKGLASFPEDQRLRVATRRLNNGVNTGVRGNGFWGAKDYFTKKGLRLPGKLGAQQLISDALERMNNNDNFSHSFSTDTPRDRRHPRREPREGDERSKSPRRTHKPRNRRQVHGGAKGMGVPSVRRNFHPVGGRRAPSSNAKTVPHFNKPRFVGAR